MVQSTSAPKKKKAKVKAGGTTRSQFELAGQAAKKGLYKERTVINYDGAVKHGREWLKDLMAQQRARMESADSLDDPPGDPFADDLAQAFDIIPNKHSAFALEYFITDKCVITPKPGSDKPCGFQTANRYQASFKKLWAHE